MEDALKKVKELSIGSGKLVTADEVGSDEIGDGTKQETQGASCEAEKGGAAMKRQGKEKKKKDEDPLECCMLDETWGAQSVKVCGWVDSLRRQGKLMFIILRLGIEKLQCVFSGDDLCKSPQALTLTTGCCVELWGKLQLVQEGKKAIGGLELNVTKWNLLGSTPPGEVENLISDKSSLLDHRHLIIREEKTARVFTVRYEVIHFLRKYFRTSKFIEVAPPLIVQTQAEEGSGSAVFEVNFHGKKGQKSYMTQSSQLYLEAVIAGLGNVYCILPSYRAEPSQTPRHLSEFTHVECEYVFITFDELMERIEDLIVYICKKLMASKFAKQILAWNPEFQIPEKPFRRMHYADAIEYLKQHNITKDDGKFCEMGEDIPQKPEKELLQKLKEPIFLFGFPADIKPFYVKKCPENRQFTESVDLLLPGVGEVVGASMRITDEKELQLALLKAGMDPESYEYYTDQRRYGTCPHGGFGLGLERLLCWLLKLDSVKDASLFPRFVGRATP